jgi:CheY-like chemotaxis protein
MACTSGANAESRKELRPASLVQHARLVLTAKTWDNGHSRRVFLAEDDKEMRRLIASTLRRRGYFVVEAEDGLGLLRDLGNAYWGVHTSTPDSVIVTDVRMPGADGLTILRGVRELPWCPPFIVITAFGDDELKAEARRLGAHAVLDKPFDIDALVTLVRDLAVSSAPDDLVAAGA